MDGFDDLFAVVPSINAWEPRPIQPRPHRPPIGPRLV